MPDGETVENPNQLSCLQDPRPYSLGHSDTEIRRLLLQAEMLRPITERLLRRADLREGMRVLDMGCGTGDVAMLAAAIVGPTGSVVGVDQSEETVSLARRRADERNFGNVSFEVATLPDLAGPKDFDVAIGRYVLVHQSDPVAFLRDIAKCVKPGGLIVCHEVYPRFTLWSSPPLALWEEIGIFLHEAAVHLPGVDACEGMHQTLEKAGLQQGEVYYELPVAQNARSPLIEWVASSVRAFLPLAKARAVADEAALDPSTLEQGSRDAMQNAGSHVTAWLQVCAWATV
ncbi:class I SAM-dependent methyltransferase [Bradyrhizobium canariense]|uniref:Methyltransferase domain-containing protein n=1 Tax=Bradyrhizobium canariense TaxID=255045 RepID=A0A1H1NE70_9BRAD|nr:class I SAM-dependent methyltransferase [Bradyrhizobium canariense]SDR97281.1 Methyltransferase domain-containing protein [Bradyrhizobium canariense]